ncbi:hypothetical protein DCW30_23785 [Streptomyces alfalfae]|nr:hypothetical protein D3X13_04845 [Streptomyces fradiae]RXX39666.1 hypothetical protein DCW30_23785 [Streptomyces alfalfae]RZN07159.1 hypothetical protein D4104_00480 [Streptomyces alfalfae]
MIWWLSWRCASMDSPGASDRVSVGASGVWRIVRRFSGMGRHFIGSAPGVAWRRWSDVNDGTHERTALPGGRQGPSPGVRHAPSPGVRHAPSPGGRHAHSPGVRHAPSPGVRHAPSPGGR